MDGHDIRRQSAVTISFSLVDGSQGMQKIVPFRSIKGQEKRETYEREAVWTDVEKVIRDVRLSHVQFFFGADMKSLLMCLGFKAANAKDGCLFCTCLKDRWNLCCVDSKCVLRGKIEGGRWALSKLGPCDPGYKAAPLIDVTLFSGVVVDTLHMYFRITDAIFGRAIGLMTKDGRENVFLQLCDDAGVKRFHVIDKCDTSIIKFSNLTRQKRRILIEKVFLRSELRKCGIGDLKARDIQEVCKRFSVVYELMAVGGSNLLLAIKRFTALFCSLFQVSSIPYYVHILAHTPLLISLYGNLHVFQQQSVENLNCHISRRYFSQTSCSTIDAVIAHNRHLFIGKKEDESSGAA